MKKHTSFWLFLSFVLMITNSYSQCESNPGKMVHFSPEKSVLFGKDIIVNNQPTIDQYQAVICSAFNGWLYVYYTYLIDHHVEFILMKSTDNGVSWTQIRKSIDGSWSEIITKMDIAASGTTADDIKIIFGKTYLDTVWQSTYTSVTCINGNTGALYGEVLNEPYAQIFDLDIESDVLNPATGSNSNSVAILYSKQGAKDSIIYRASSNGGLSFDYRKPVATTTNHFRKVSLSYGKVPSWNTGRYFGTWEELASTGSTVGHVFSAHSEPNFNSPFTTPVCLDCLIPAWTNQVRNPVVACQSGNSDNNFGNLTEVVLFETPNQPTSNNDILGLFNVEAASTDNFSPLSVAASINNELQADICYNPVSSKFMLTYYNETEKKLPYLTQDVNITNPLEIIIQGYNDSLNISSPFPKVKYSTSTTSGVFVWNAKRTNGNGMALFDAPYLFPTSVPGSWVQASTTNLNICPNPVSSIMNVSFTMKMECTVNIIIQDIKGNNLYQEQLLSVSGLNEIEMNMSAFSSGQYILTLWSPIGYNKVNFIKL